MTLPVTNQWVPQRVGSACQAGDDAAAAGDLDALVCGHAGLFVVHEQPRTSNMTTYPPASIAFKP